jgi:hypothetical protein
MRKRQLKRIWETDELVARFTLTEDEIAWLYQSGLKVSCIFGGFTMLQHL